jgi:hypothetical protein
MIKEKDIKVGAKFCWDGERVDASGIGEEFSGYYLHQFGTDERDFSYAFSNKSEYPTTFTIVGLDKIDNIECAINDGEMSIVMGKKDIMRFAHLEDAEPEELHQGSLSVPLKVEFGESTLALHHAEDVATMRQVLLQIVNWFKTGHRKLPLTLAEPFNDDVCNELYGTIFEWMKDEKEDKE